MREFRFGSEWVSFNEHHIDVKSGHKLTESSVQYNWSPVPPDQWTNMPMSELGMLFFTDLWGSGRVYGSGERVYC